MEIDLSFITLEYFKKELRQYIQLLFEQGLDIKGILLFGSLAIGTAKYNDKHISDIDLIIIYNDLPKNSWERKEFVFNLTKSVCSGIQAFWWTSEELEKHMKSKYYLILDAFDEGRILYDPDNYLLKLKEDLFKELNEKGVIKTDLYWQWPIKKFGDKIDF